MISLPHLYRSRIALAGLLLASACFAAKPVSYPPYPDQWLWLPEGSTPTEPPSTTLRRMPSGDVLVAYAAEGQSAPSTRIETYFSKAVYSSVEAAFGGRFPLPDDRRRVELRDGTFAQGISTGGCGRGLGSVISIEDSRGEQLRAKSLLLLLDRPVKRPAIVCEEVEQPAWESSVVIVDPGGLLALADGTLLVVDNTSGAVARLQPSLAPGSNVRRVRTMDPQALIESAQNFGKARPSGQMDLPAYFQHLRQTYFKWSRSDR
jgi:hypothetical protein